MEGFLKGKFKIVCNKILIVGKLLDNMFGTIFGNLHATMSVKNGKQKNLLAKSMKDHSVFHVFPPALIN